MFRNYNYFLEIEKQRNITKASEILYTSQPSLSKYLNKLESELGVTLFDRSISPLRLTNAGALYLKYLNQYIQLESNFQSELDKFKDPFQKVTIGIASWRGSLVLPPIYGNFLPKHLNYSIEVKEGSGSYTQQLLESNKVDFCLMNVANNTINSNFNCLTLDWEDVCVAISKEHPYLKSAIDSGNTISEIDLKELENETFIMLLDSQNLSKKVYQIFNYLGVKPRKIIKTQNLNTALNIASYSHGITFYPSSNKFKKFLNDDLMSLKIKDNNFKIPFDLIYNKNNEFSEASQTLINFIFSMFELEKTI